MIWDRFDDAMDDLDRDARAARAEIEQLEAELKALGVELPADRGTELSSRPYDGPQSLYLDRGDEVGSVESRRDALRALVDAGRTQRARRRMFLRGAGIGGAAIVALGAGGAWLWLNRGQAPLSARGIPLRLELMPARDPPDERDLKLMVTLALVIDRQSTIAVVAGNGGRLLRADPAPYADRAQARIGTVCAIRWGEGDRLEVSLSPVDGAEYWRETYLRAPGEDQIALARRVASRLAENLRPIVK